MKTSDCNIEKLIDHYQRYHDIEKLSAKIMTLMPMTFAHLTFDAIPFCTNPTTTTMSASKRASVHRIRDAVYYLSQCYWYAGITRPIPIDMIELSMAYNREIDKRPLPESLLELITLLTRKVVTELRYRRVSEVCARQSGGEFKVGDTLLTIAVNREPPDTQAALTLLMHFFLNRQDHPETRHIGLINPVTGQIYTLPILGISKERAYMHNVLHDILAR